MGKDGGHDTYFPGRAAESRSGIKQKSSKIVHQGRPFFLPQFTCCFVDNDPSAPGCDSGCIRLVPCVS